MLQFVINGLVAGSIYTLLALGFALIYRTVGFFHLAHGAAYITGAYAAYLLHRILGCPLLLSVAGGVVTAGVLGVLMECTVYKPLRKKSRSTLAFLLASFGIIVVVQNFIAVIFGSQVVNILESPVRKRIVVGSVTITDWQLIIFLTTIVVFIALRIFIQVTHMGKKLRAVNDDQIGAYVIGIDVQKTICTVFFIGSCLAGLAGVLVSIETNMHPTIGFSAVLFAIVACIIGGMGTLEGALLGAYLLGLIENVGIIFVSSQWKDGMAFFILFIALIIRPQGILGSRMVLRLR